MPDLEYFLVAESFSVDQNTDRISLFNVVETVAFETFPGVLPQLVAVSSWKIHAGEEGEAVTLALRIHPPDQQGAPREFGMVLEPGKARRRRAMIGYLGFPFTGPGDWVFEILAAGRHAASHTVTVSQREPATSQSGSPPART